MEFWLHDIVSPDMRLTISDEKDGVGLKISFYDPSTEKEGHVKTTLSFKNSRTLEDILRLVRHRSEEDDR